MTPDDVRARVEAVIAQLEARGETPTANAVCREVQGRRHQVLAVLAELRGTRVAVGAGMTEEQPEDTPATPLPAPMSPDWTEAQAVKKQLLDKYMNLVASLGAVDKMQKTVDAATLAVLIEERRQTLGLLIEWDPRRGAAQHAAQALVKPYQAALAAWDVAKRQFEFVRPRLDEARTRAIVSAQNRWLENQYPSLIEDIRTLERRLKQEPSRGLEMLLQETRTKLYQHRPEAPTWTNEGPRDDLPRTN